MATVTYVVQKNDTLSEIAAAHNTTVEALVALNGIENPDLIYVGQKLIISGSPSSSSTKKSTKKQATIKQFGVQTGTDRTVFATWTWSKSNTKNYEIRWYYNTNDGVWFEGDKGTVTVKQSTYNAPSNAVLVKFKVKPVAKTRKKNGKQTAYWTANWSTEKTHHFDTNPPVTPDGLSVTLEGFKLTATLDNLDVNATQIEFEVTQDNSTVTHQEKVPINKGHASYSCTVAAGHEYKVRCRSWDGNDRSDWSAYSANYAAGPATPTEITELKVWSETSAYISWPTDGYADGYIVEYTTKTEYFDTTPNNVTQVSVDKGVSNTYITGLGQGEEYFFRVCATKGSEKSGWTPVKSLIIGTTPSAPTTWSSTTTAIISEPLILYWVHNSEDGSSQTSADLELIIGGTTNTYKITGTGRYKIGADGILTTIEEYDEESEKYNTNSCEIVISNYSEGTKIRWRVKTAGITAISGDWSIERTVDVYAPAYIERFGITDQDGNPLDVVTGFPFYIYGLPGPQTQAPLGYHLSIISNETYDTVDQIGNEITVSQGDEVYSKYIDSYSLTAMISANSVDLENNVSYTLKCTASMNSGLTAEATDDFTVSWTDDEYEPDAEIGIDDETLTALIRPYCEHYPMEYHSVWYETSTGIYHDTGTLIEGEIEGESVNNAITPEGHVVYSDGIRYFCIVEATEPSLAKDVTLSVYRREYDGTFVEIASGLDNTENAFVTDPHPALDYARYRIVAVTNSTGAVSYTDIPGIPVGESAVVIQWDEEWSSFETNTEDVLEKPPWSGSMLRLPYNIDVSDSNKLDVSLVNYIGRSHPVSYYGTHLGSSSTWNVEIPRDDVETLYALRRLSRWMGDVYVREPSGSGYWANISVSFSQKHREVTIPVSFSITRVEGGM